LIIPKKLHAFLLVIPIVLGCLVFLYSIILPFYGLVGSTIDGPYWRTYWSFKADYFVVTTRPFLNHYSFFGYWNDNNFVGSSSAMPYILLAMFTAQVLVLIFGIASVYLRRRAILAAPICMCLAVLALMSVSGELLYGTYQLGYYLVYPSIAMFLLAFILNELQRRDK